MAADKKHFVILLVDDRQENLEVLVSKLKMQELDMLYASSGEEALEVAQSEIPDIILMDVLMPGMDGFETCRQLKLHEKTHDIPVIFMTALADQESKIRGFQLGSVDYVTKPLEYEEVLARINAHVTIRKQHKVLENINVELENQLVSILEQKRILQEIARTDPLTNLPNRRDFYDRANQEQAHFKRTEKPFTVAFSDIDNFKSINDSHGHDCGDVILVEMARTMRGMLRQEDYLARWGGDEFIFLLRDTDGESARILIDRIREKISGISYTYDDLEFSNTITFGACEYNSSLTIEECIKYADQMLIEGKSNGRNSVLVA